MPILRRCGSLLACSLVFACSGSSKPTQDDGTGGRASVGGNSNVTSATGGTSGTRTLANTDTAGNASTGGVVNAGGTAGQGGLSSSNTSPTTAGATALATAGGSSTTSPTSQVTGGAIGAGGAQQTSGGSGLAQGGTAGTVTGALTGGTGLAGTGGTSAGTFGGTSGTTTTGGTSVTAGFTSLSGDLRVSKPFYLHGPRPIQPATDFVGASMACLSDGCLVAYGQTIGGRRMVLASRVSPTGSVLDKIVLSSLDDVNAQVLNVEVATNGTGYLVYSYLTVTANSSPNNVHKFQTLNSSGNVLKSSTSVFTQPMDVRLYGGGANYLLVFGTSNLLSEVQLLNANLELVGSNYEPGFTYVRAMPGPAGYLLYDNSMATAINDTTGQVSAGLQTYWQYGSPTAALTGFATDEYYVILGTRPGDTDTRDTYAIRFSDKGVLLDPDNSFDQVSGGILLCKDCGGDVDAAVAMGDTGLATVINGANSGVFRFTLSPVARVGASMGVETTLTARRPRFMTHFADHLLALDKAVVENFSVASGTFGITFGPDSIVVPYSADITGPSVAYAGSRYLVSGQGMTPTFVDAQTATLQAVAGLAESSGGQVADDDTSFLLTQEVAGQVVARSISSTGALGAEHSVTPSPVGNYDLDFRLTSNKHNYLLTAIDKSSTSGNRISGIRIAADGTFLDQGQEIYNGTSYGVYGVAGDFTPEPAYRTYGIFALPSNLQWLRLRAESGNIVTPVNWLPATSNPYATTDGTSFMVAYDSSDSGLLKAYAALLDPGSGTTNVAPTVLNELTAGYVRGAWYDGRSYFVGQMQQDVPAGDPSKRFSVWRYGPQLTSVDASVTGGYEIVPDKFHPYMDTAPVMAGDHDGHSLLAYQYADPVYGGVTLRGVFVENTIDFTPLPPQATCDGADFFEFGSTLLTEGSASAGGKVACDPNMGASFAGDLGIWAYYGAAFGTPNQLDTIYFAHNIAIWAYGELPTTLPASYEIGVDSTPGRATMSVYTNDETEYCQVTSGTVTITAIGAAHGGAVVGSYNATGFDGTGCPTSPIQGDFSVTRWL